MRQWLAAAAAALALGSTAAATPQFDVIAALQNLRAGRGADALYLLNRAIESRALPPGELADALEWRAYVRMQQRSFGTARLDLDAAIAADKDNALRLRARARFFLRLSDYRAALADIEAVLGRFPTDAENYADYCEALLGLGRRAEALQQCRKAVQVNPEYARARTLLRRAGGR